VWAFSPWWVAACAGYRCRMAETGYFVDPAKLDEHIKDVRALADQVHRAADPIPDLYPAGGPSWTGTDGGAALLRTCLKEIATALHKTSSRVTSYADGATNCLTRYTKADKEGAARLRACLIEVK
jgi:hypothetical protein